MKKTLVAVAALAAFSGAFAQATISGRVDVALTLDGTDSVLGAGPNGGSEITVAASEDLGNGLKATGAITMITNIVNTGIPDSGDAAYTGDEQAINMYNSHIGLSGDFGSVKLGSQFSPVFFVGAAGDITGFWNSYGAAQPSERQNAQSVTYTSPSISGVTFSYQRQMGVNGTVPSGFINRGAGAAEAYSLTYSAGGLTIAYGNGADATNGNTTVISANYDFGVAKVSYSTLTSTHDAAGAGAERTGNQFGVSAPFGAFTVGAQFSSDGDDETGSSYFAHYAVSKRTLAYLSSNTTTAGVLTTSVGLKHDF